MAKVTSEYNADSIEVVQNIDHCRKRPLMYISGTDASGCQSLVKEIIDNCVDEVMAGHVDAISIKLNMDENSVTISDNGRGIPVDQHKKTKMSALTTVFMLTGAGGKFGSGAYKTSAGLHGVGVTVVTALSEWLDVWSVRGGKAYHLRFEQGVCKNKDNEPNVDTKFLGKSGVTVSFKPDPAIFKKYKFNPATIKAFLKELSYLCSGLTINYTVVTAGKEEPFVFEAKNGLAQMLSEQMEEEGLDPLHETLIYRSETIEAAIVWANSSRDEKWWVFCNSSFLPEGGTPVTGVKRLITQLVAGKAEKTIENDDIRIGLHVAIHVKVKEPEFKGQTKTRLLNRDVEKQIYDELFPTLETFCQKNPKIIESIVKRALKLKAAREKFEKEKEATKNITTFAKGKRGILPGKLLEAPKAKPEDRELFLVEGDSALGTGRMARNANFQELLPLKGKIPNASQKTRAQILDNEEIQAIITAIGAGIEDNCKPSRSRSGKILLLMDADPDGQHITSLVLSLFAKYMRPLIEEGMLYIVDSPLFKAANGTKHVFGMTLAEVTQQFPKNSKLTITRIKGHGEAGFKDLAYYAMDPESRKLLKVVCTDDTDSVVLQVTGPDSSFRKILLNLQ